MKKNKGLFKLLYPISLLCMGFVLLLTAVRSNAWAMIAEGAKLDVAIVVDFSKGPLACLDEEIPDFGERAGGAVADDTDTQEPEEEPAEEPKSVTPVKGARTGGLPQGLGNAPESDQAEKGVSGDEGDESVQDILEADELDVDALHDDSEDEEYTDEPNNLETDSFSKSGDSDGFENDTVSESESTVTEDEGENLTGEDISEDGAEDEGPITSDDGQS